MVKQKSLTASRPLDGRSLSVGGTSLWVVADRPIYSLSVPLGGDEGFDRALSVHFGVSERPEAGRFCDGVTDENGAFRLCGLARDQVFALALQPGKADARTLAQGVGDAAYVTDQSDAWVVVSLRGPLAFAAMERICPVNLAPSIFLPGSLARTVMEHLSVIIVADLEGGFMMLSPLSSAESFWHALETSLANVLTP